MKKRLHIATSLLVGLALGYYLSPKIDKLLTYSSSDLIVNVSDTANIENTGIESITNGCDPKLSEDLLLTDAKYDGVGTIYFNGDDGYGYIFDFNMKVGTLKVDNKNNRLFAESE